MSKKILVVEDEPVLSKALDFKLKDEGFEVIVAHDGAEGLELAEKSQPDIILCDIRMPKMDGCSMIRAVRETAWGKNLPAIMLTNINDPAKVAEAMKHNVLSYLVKSDMDLAQVVEKVRDGLTKAGKK